MTATTATSYDVEIANALSEYLRPIIMTGEDGSLVPVIKGIPSFLERVHKIIEAL